MANRFRQKEEPVYVEETELLAAAPNKATPVDTPTTAQNDNPEEQKQQEEPKKNISNWSRKLLGGEILTTRKALKQLPLILLIVILSIIMVSNRYTVERLRKDIIKTQKEIEELSLQQIQMKSQYQQSIKISSISSTLDSMGVHLVTEPPLTLHE